MCAFEKRVNRQRDVTTARLQRASGDKRVTVRERVAAIRNERYKAYAAKMKALRD